MKVKHPYITDVSQLIESYLNNHPQAQDTLDGVVDWWLQKQLIDNSTAVVKDSLDRLIQKGVVAEVIRDKTVYYKLVHKTN